MPIKYESLKEFSAAEKVPLAIVKEARKYVPECFNHGRVIDVEALKEYVSTHYEDLEAEACETLEALKKERMRKQITRDDYKFEMVKGKHIDKAIVLERITNIANAQKILLKSALLESLPAKLVGLSQTDILVELEKTYNAICKEMQSIKL